MVRHRGNKEERQQALRRYLRSNPFATDEELAEKFEVSVPTIRLDRLALGIPEVRERIMAMAQEARSRMRGVTAEELVGELVELQPGVMGISILEITPPMLVQPAGVARGYYLFAQAHSLALATVGAEVVLTSSARVRYRRPVYAGERVVARAMVKMVKDSTCLVSVHSRVNGEIVFKGQYIIITPDAATGGGSA
ncbi:transcription factor FapR [Neomoorella thermoacetica]|uniref:transcription factor FapR n=1 Tax=Neomoorella thermoacetica TaxID=1525 RepID=UPI0008FB48BE|nr:transcription factor FapR [Moorella thermoacetica]OIQ62112.1 transcription factor FapR [Moorella thermoacetica]